MNASVGSSLSLCWHDDGRFNQERDGVINDTLTNSIIVAVPVHINFFFCGGQWSQLPSTAWLVVCYIDGDDDVSSQRRHTKKVDDVAVHSRRCGETPIVESMLRYDEVAKIAVTIMIHHL